MDFSRLGEPDIKIVRLSIWVHGREFPESADYWDANWLRVTALCSDHGASVRASGAIIHLAEFETFREGCRKLYDTLQGKAELACMEPYLAVTVTPSDSLGNLTVEVRITPDHLRQEHTFRLPADQSYLPEIVRSLERIAEEYPLRGSAG